MESKIRYAFYALLLSLGTGVIYSLLERFFGEEKWFPNLILGVLLTVLVGPASGFLLDLRSEMRQQTRALRERIDAQAEALREQTDAQAKALRESIDLQTEDAAQLRENLARDAEGLERKRLDISGLGPVLQAVANPTLDQHLEGFVTKKGGFTVAGEYLSLEVYKRFWTELVELQIRQTALFGDSDKHRLIARVSHANDIGIWDPDRNSSALILLKLQESFIRAGGRVIRIFVSEHPRGAIETYDKVIQLMEARGIEVRYLQYHHDYGFDLIWVDPVGLVVKWRSGAVGKRLESCEVLEEVKKDVKEQWEALGVATEDRDGKLKSIPDIRQFEVGYRPAHAEPE